MVTGEYRVASRFRVVRSFRFAIRSGLSNEDIGRQCRAESDGRRGCGGENHSQGKATPLRQPRARHHREVRFDGVRPGNYEVAGEHEGFKPATSRVGVAGRPPAPPRDPAEPGRGAVGGYGQCGGGPDQHECCGPSRDRHSELTIARQPAHFRPGLHRHDVPVS